MKYAKIVIIGAGKVGSSIAYNLMLQGICNEIVFIDIDKKLARAQAVDLQDCAMFLNRHIVIHDGEYSDCTTADVIIITAAVPLIQGQSRLDMVESAYYIIKCIIPEIMKHCFNGHFIIITNPVDVVSYFVYKLSGLPKNKIIGTGTALDTARLRKTLSEIIKTDIKDIQAYVIGEHGDSQIIPWSLVTIRGKPLKQLLADNNSEFNAVDLKTIENKIIQSGWEIADVKGTTNFGISSTVVEIVKAIICNKTIVLPVSALLEGEFDEYDVFAGVPTLINANGIQEVIQINIKDYELKGFKRSVSIIREVVNECYFKSNM